jgi:hypothetical protein
MNWSNVCADGSKPQVWTRCTRQESTVSAPIRFQYELALALISNMIGGY